MGFNVLDYQRYKTVKLSDAFVVEIKDYTTKDGAVLSKRFNFNGKEDEQVLDNADGTVNAFLNNVVSVKIPNIKSTVDQLKYNYHTHGFVRRDLDADIETLDLTLYETSDNKVHKLLNYLMSINGFNEYSYGTNNPYDTISEINVYILNNNLTKAIFVYNFKDLKLVNYDYSYSYDYKDSNLPTVSLSFSYASFSYGMSVDPIYINDDDIKQALVNKTQYKPFVKSKQV